MVNAVCEEVVFTSVPEAPGAHFPLDLLKFLLLENLTILTA